MWKINISKYLTSNFTWKTNVTNNITNNSFSPLGGEKNSVAPFFPRSSIKVTDTFDTQVSPFPKGKRKTDREREKSKWEKKEKKKEEKK